MILLKPVTKQRILLENFLRTKPPWRGFRGFQNKNDYSILVNAASAPFGRIWWASLPLPYD
jgi:hypothetical protein